MPMLYLTTPGTRVRAVGERLRVRTPRAEFGVAVRDLDGLIAFGGVGVSSGAVRRCLISGVPIAWCSSRGRLLGLAHAPGPDTGVLHAGQALLLLDDRHALRTAVRTAAEKLEAQLRHTPCARAAVAIRRAADRTRGATTVTAVRGYEGAAARAWWRAWKEHLPAELGFTGRQRRPAPDPINAALGVAGVLLVAEASAVAAAAGLQPTLGVLHRPFRQLPALACDLVEPLRPPIEAALMAWGRQHAARLSATRSHADRASGCLLGPELLREVIGVYEHAMGHPTRSATLRSQLTKTVAQWRADAMQAAVSRGLSR